jgi:transposase
MAEPVRARRLSDEEGRRLLQIVRRGKHGSIRVRRAMIIMASASGTLVPAIARLVAAGEDTVRDVIHAFNAKGLAALDPGWAGGRPRLISDGDIEVIVTAARTRPEKPVQPFTHWSLRKLAGYLAGLGRPVRIGRERLRQLLHERGISFQRTRTWKGVHRSGPGRQAGPDRVRDQRLPGPLLRLRPVRAAADPALPRRVPGAAHTAGTAARDLSSHPRHLLLPWLLLRGR